MGFRADLTIKVGAGDLRTVSDICAALLQKGHRISGSANDILDKPGFTVASQEDDVRLVVKTTSQLIDSEGGGKTTEVFAGAVRLGLEKCHSDDGLWLRLCYLDQPPNDWLLIGMEPSADSDGDSYVFNVGRDGGVLCLTASCANPNRRWRGDDRWVFRLPKSS